MLNETFSFIVELYFGYHICIDPIRASLCLHFLSVIFVLWLCLRVSFLMSVLSVGLSIILLLADAAGQAARAARDLCLRRAPPRAPVPRVSSSKAPLFLTVMPRRGICLS